MSDTERPAPGVGRTGGLPGANAHPATGHISEDEMADAVSMAESADGGEPPSERGETATNS